MWIRFIVKPWFLTEIQFLHQIFLLEGKPLHIWTATGLAVTWWSMLMSGNQFVMVMMDVNGVDWWKTGFWLLDTGTGTGCRKQETEMADDLGYITDECGRFSISSWLDAGCPTPKTENHLKSPKFWRFQIWINNFYCPPQETTQSQWNLHV